MIFDLDETLIHCNDSSEMKSDVILPIRFPTGENIQVLYSPKFSNLGWNKHPSLREGNPVDPVSAFRNNRVHSLARLLRERGAGPPGPATTAHPTPTLPRKLRTDRGGHLRQGSQGHQQEDSGHGHC